MLNARSGQIRMLMDDASCRSTTLDQLSPAAVKEIHLLSADISGLPILKQPDGLVGRMPRDSHIMVEGGAHDDRVFDCSELYRTVRWERLLCLAVR